MIFDLPSLGYMPLFHVAQAFYPMKKCNPINRLELVELLDGLASAGKHAEDVEADLLSAVSQIILKSTWEV